LVTGGSPSPAAPPHSPYAAFREPAFCRFILGSQLVQIGKSAQGLAIGWEIYQRTGEPRQVYGFVAVGPSGEWPTAEDFAKLRPVEKGPAFGTFEEASRAANDWPLFRHDAARSGATPALIPPELKESWREQVASPPGDDKVAEAWKCQGASCLSAPVVTEGLVCAARTDAGQVVALDATTGKQAWCVSLGSRIDSPPTLYRGLCFVGCHEGYLYALRASDGQLAWRVRIAPWERRMVAFGMVESVWPVVGTVVIHNNVLYAHAGRTSESDGGIAVVALDPATGRQLWGRASAPGPLHQNDLLRYDAGALLWNHLALDPNSGEGNLSVGPSRDDSQGGMLDGTWTAVGKRRAGNAFHLGRVTADLLAWDNKLVVGPAFAIGLDKALTAPELKPEDYVWKAPLPKNYQVEAVALTGNAVLYAGRDTQASDPAQTGFLWVASLADGTKLAVYNLRAIPTYDGVAVANGHVYVSLQDGTLLCFG